MKREEELTVSVKAEDWENACHELIWLVGDTELFERISNAARMNAEQRPLSTPKPEAEPVAWQHPEAGWACENWQRVRIHCKNNGPMPIPLYAHPPKPEATEEAGEQWSALENGHPATSWYPIGYGDKAGWDALAKRNPEKYQVITRKVFAASEATEGGAHEKGLGRTVYGWFVKDFADGWIFFDNEADAERQVEATGAMMLVGFHPASVGSPSERLAKWLEDGPKLAKAAGCHVGIKVSAALTAKQTDVREGE